MRGGEMKKQISIFKPKKVKYDCQLCGDVVLETKTDKELKEETINYSCCDDCFNRIIAGEFKDKIINRKYTFVFFNDRSK